MADRLMMSGSAYVARAGASPKLDREIYQACLRIMMSQGLRLSRHQLLKFSFEHLGDTRMQLLTLTAQKSAIAVEAP